jgi:hypothetical protein
MRQIDKAEEFGRTPALFTNGNLIEDVTARND